MTIPNPPSVIQPVVGCSTVDIEESLLEGATEATGLEKVLGKGLAAFELLWGGQWLDRVQVLGQGLFESGDRKLWQSVLK